MTVSTNAKRLVYLSYSRCLTVTKDGEVYLLFVNASGLVPCSRGGGLNYSQSFMLDVVECRVETADKSLMVVVGSQPNYSLYSE